MSEFDADYSALASRNATVSYPDFFRCTPLSLEQRQRCDKWDWLPTTYIAFLRKFGSCRWFRELYREHHLLLIYPPKNDLEVLGGREYLVFGSIEESDFAFARPIPGAKCDGRVVRLSSRGSVSGTWDRFEGWVEHGWSRCRARYGKRKWADVLRGPVPFNARELEVLSVRRGFKWEHVSNDVDCLLVRVENGSHAFLSHLTVGVRGPNFFGGYYIDVSAVAPGEVRLLRVSARHYLPVCAIDRMVMFDKGDPRPETRHDYKELLVLK